MNWIILLAMVIAFVIGFFMTPYLLPVLHKLKFGQQVREDGPQSHLKKSGTPTMGGISIVAAMVVGSIVFINTGSEPGENLDHTLVVIIMTLLYSAVGFVDDYLKIKKHESEGLKAWQKMAFQAVWMIGLILYIAFVTENGTSVIVPFVGLVDFKGWFFPLAVFAILGTVNGANFTDGLDGLASWVTIIIALFMTFAYGMIFHQLNATSLAMIGSLSAFLIYNRYPAKIFMGDTGSLALGGFVVAEAFIMKIPIFLIFTAFVYLVEIISVIIQVAYFKKTHGKRFFRMAPIHHHFELGGWNENKVVYVFTMATVVLSIIGLVGLALA